MRTRTVKKENKERTHACHNVFHALIDSEINTICTCHCDKEAWRIKRNVEKIFVVHKYFKWDFLILAILSVGRQSTNFILDYIDFVYFFST